MIITVSNGSTTVGIQNLIFYSTDGISLTSAISTNGVGIGTTNVTYPNSIYNAYITQLMRNVGFGTYPDSNYSIDIMTANDVRIKVQIQNLNI